MTDYKPFNAITGKPYNGGNIIVLTSAAKSLNQLGDPRWLTFLQAKELGAHVKKGSHGVKITFASTQETETENGEKKSRNVYKQYTVFHASQIEGIPPYHA